MAQTLTFKILFWFSYLTSLYLFLMPVGHSGIEIPHLDKIAHLIVFLGLAFLFDYAYDFTQDKKISVLVAYGLIIEVLQSTTGRESSVPDAIADLVGILLYFYVFKHWVNKIKFDTFFARVK